MVCVTINVSPAHSPRVGLLLCSYKVTKKIFGKRLLYAQAMPHKRSEQTQAGIFCPANASHGPTLLQNLQCLFPTRKAIIVLPAFGRSCLPEKRIESQDKM